MIKMHVKDIGSELGVKVIVLQSVETNRNTIVSIHFLHGRVRPLANVIGHRDDLCVIDMQCNQITWAEFEHTYPWYTHQSD